MIGLRDIPPGADRMSTTPYFADNAPDGDSLRALIADGFTPLGHHDRLYQANVPFGISQIVSAKRTAAPFPLDLLGFRRRRFVSMITLWDVPSAASFDGRR